MEGPCKEGPCVGCDCNRYDYICYCGRKADYDKKHPKEAKKPRLHIRLWDWAKKVRRR